mgnify:CR=1 FL=1
MAAIRVRPAVVVDKYQLSTSYFCRWKIRPMPRTRSFKLVVGLSRLLLTSTFTR